jgi:8-oxo-dGTP diphosphatase
MPLWFRQKVQALSRQAKLGCTVPESEASAVLHLHVAAGVLQDDCGRVLIAQRPEAGHMGGAWEFPGGKIAPGELPVHGMIRELREELAIETHYLRHLTRYSHQYADRLVHLYVWKILGWDGEPVGAEGQPLRWVKPADLVDVGLLAADEAIASLLVKDVALNQRKPIWV